MAGLYEMFFLLQFLTVIVITLVKTYNLMVKGKLYDIKMAIMLFIIFVIGWGVGLTVFLINPETTLYHMLFRFETWFIVLNVGYLIAEILIHLGTVGEKVIKAYMPDKNPEKS